MFGKNSKKIKGKSSTGESSWGVTAIYVDVNKWEYAFNSKICKIKVTKPDLGESKFPLE